MLRAVTAYGAGPILRALAMLALVLVLARVSEPSGAAAAQASVEPDAATAALLAEARRSFTLNGKRVPPEIFRDFGDGDLADSSDIWVTVNIAAAIGSNLYADDVVVDGDWVVQKKVPRQGDQGEETAYKFIGTTANGLLIAVVSHNSGGSGYFYTLHILDLAPARAIDLDGRPYWQINLTLVRSIVLGDRWQGEVSIAQNAVHVLTTRKGPADDSGTQTEMTVTAERP